MPIIAQLDALHQAKVRRRRELRLERLELIEHLCRFRPELLAQLASVEEALQPLTTARAKVGEVGHGHVGRNVGVAEEPVNVGGEALEQPRLAEPSHNLDESRMLCHDRSMLAPGRRRVDAVDA